MADTVFLRTWTIVDAMQEMGIGEKSECAENGGAVDSRQCSLQVCQAEGIAEAMTYLAPYQQADSRKADAGIVEYLFVRNIQMHTATNYGWLSPSTYSSKNMCSPSYTA